MTPPKCPYDMVDGSKQVAQPPLLLGPLDEDTNSLSDLF